MSGANSKKQAKVQRLKELYESMTEERLKELDKEIQEITAECDDFLQGAAEDAGRVASSRFYDLVVRWYTEDEIEAVLKHHNPGRFEYDVYEDLWDLWKRDRLKESKQQRVRRNPIQKGATE